MSDKAPKDITDILRRPFPKEAIKKRVIGGNRKADYVEGHTVILRLIEATENQFDVRVVNLNLGDALVTATVELTIPGLGSRQHIGVQKVSVNGGEDLVKGAITDALKKAATLFGVALELYGDDYEAHAESSTQQTPPKRQQQPAPPTDPDGLPGAKKPGHYKATPEQRAEIVALWQRSGATPEALNAWIAKINKGNPIEGLTMERADWAIARIKDRLKTLGEVQQPAPQGEDLDLGAF